MSTPTYYLGSLNGTKINFGEVYTHDSELGKVVQRNQGSLKIPGGTICDSIVLTDKDNDRETIEEVSCIKNHVVKPGIDISYSKKEFDILYADQAKTSMELAVQISSFLSDSAVDYMSKRISREVETGIDRVELPEWMSANIEFMSDDSFINGGPRVFPVSEFTVKLVLDPEGNLSFFKKDQIVKDSLILTVEIEDKDMDDVVDRIDIYAEPSDPDEYFSSEFSIHYLSGAMEMDSIFYELTDPIFIFMLNEAAEADRATK